MADLTGIGSIASAGSSLLGGIFGLIGQKKANQTNLRINQMNNEFNERMMNKQMAWNEEMWNKQNAYNDPSAMMSRYRAAGLNPGLMMAGNSSAGTASSVGGISPASSSGNPVMQPEVFDTSSLSAALAGLDSIFMEKKRQSIVNEGLQLDNDYKRASFMSRLDELKQRVDSGALKNEFQKMLNQQSRLTFDSSVDAINERNNREKLITQGVIFDNALKDLNVTKEKTILKYLDWNQQFDLVQKAYNIFNSDASYREKEASIGKLVAERAAIIEDTRGKKIDNDVKDATKENLIDSLNAKYTYDNQYYWNKDGATTAASENQENWNNMWYNITLSGSERAELEKLLKKLQIEHEAIVTFGDFLEAIYAGRGRVKSARGKKK